MIGFSRLSIAAAVLSVASGIALPNAGGTVVVVGGALADDNVALYKQIIGFAGGSQAKFGVLTAGSVPESQDPNASNSNCSNSKCNGLFYGNLLTKYGAASATWIPIDLDHKSATEDAALAASVSQMTGFFIGGGDQSRYTDLLVRSDGVTDTAVLAAMRAAIQKGAAVAGSSAGAAILQRGPMVTSGESYYGLRDGSSTNLTDDDNPLTYRPGGGFGFFQTGLIDTHFGVRGRQGRLVRLLTDTKQQIGFGVDEDTALISTGGTLTVSGTNGVHVFNVTDAQVTNSGEWAVRTARWSMLTAGDSYNVATTQITPASGKTPYKGDDRSTSFNTNDIFSSPDNRDGQGYDMVLLAKDLVKSHNSDSASGDTYENSPAFKVTLSPGFDYAAWRSSSGVLSFQDMVVDIGPN